MSDASVLLSAYLLPSCLLASLPPCLVPFHLFGAKFTPLPDYFPMPTRRYKLTLE
jgi:hypothetical protein